jgi:hypothetical protein
VILSQNLFSNICFYHKKAPKKHHPFKKKDFIFMMIWPTSWALSHYLMCNWNNIQLYFINLPEMKNWARQLPNQTNALKVRRSKIRKLIHVLICWVEKKEGEIN